MPRGHYERKNKKNNTQKTDTAVAATSNAVSAQSAKVSAIPTTINVAERFGILRENLTTLTHVRSSLSGIDGISKKTELEILEHLAVLKSLRQLVFGKTSDEMESDRAMAPVAPAMTVSQVPPSPFPAAFPTPVA